MIEVANVGRKTDDGPRTKSIIGTQVDLREWVWIKMLNRYVISRV